MRKIYTKPIVTRIEIDKSISLVMMSAPSNPPPRGGGSKGNNDSQPFQSPFGDKPFS
jgi:hypothetical protein